MSPAAEPRVRAAIGQTEQTKSSWDACSAYLGLEEPIREIRYMAGIARDLAYDLLDIEKPETDEVIIRMSKRQHEQLFFAIQNAHNRAENLEKIYCCGFQSGEG